MECTLQPCFPKYPNMHSEINQTSKSIEIFNHEWTWKKSYQSLQCWTTKGPSALMSPCTDLHFTLPSLPFLSNFLSTAQVHCRLHQEWRCWGFAQCLGPGFFHQQTIYLQAVQHMKEPPWEDRWWERQNKADWKLHIISVQVLFLPGIRHWEKEALVTSSTLTRFLNSWEQK